MPFDIDLLQIGRLYTRPQLAELWGYAGYEAIARGVVTPKNSGCILLFVTREKQESLTQYKDFINGDRLHWQGEQGHRTDLRIARAHHNGEEIHLFYREIHHTPFKYLGQVLINLFVPRTTEPSSFLFSLLHDLGPEDDVSQHQAELEELSVTERDAVVRARVGQGEFRDALLQLWGGCAITGIDRPQLLRASHIKPWRFSSNSERLSRFNGLLLLPQYDHLFDRGFITFENDGRLEPSPVIIAFAADQLGIEFKAKLRSLSHDHIRFLEFHREEVFVSRRQGA